MKVKFHLGVNYDMNSWYNIPECRVFPCQEQQEVSFKVKDKSGEVKKQTRKQLISIYLVVTPTTLLMLRTNDKMRNVAKLHACASLSAIEKVKNGLQNQEQVTI